MSVLVQTPPAPGLVDLHGSAPRSPAGPVHSLEGLCAPPALRLPRIVQNVWFGRWQADYVFRHSRKFGDVWRADGYVSGRPAVTSHPDHVKSLFTASPELAPTLAPESPLAPVLGPNSTLIAREPRHLPQRKLLLPPFHGEAIARYSEMITAAARREIDRWPVGRPFALAPRMQAITLDVIMGGIFGIDVRPQPGTLEHRLRQAIRGLNRGSTLPGAKLSEWMNLGHDEPVGLLKLALVVPDRCVYALIEKRRNDPNLDQRTDIMSVIMRAPKEGGGVLSDRELRDELMTLVLAGHETTANQLAWTWERLVRSPEAHTRLVEAVRTGGAEADLAIESVLLESMRSRPVIPMTGRRVTVPWQLGDYGIPADTAVAISILLLHHREDVYPDPFAFRPERWDGHKPGTYEWIPFGGGTRRCLGATLAMAEMRVVLRAMAERLDLRATTHRPERPLHRNVTMIPHRGARVVVRSRL
ncbi:MAG TPA: cytochrome P450 [Solirubrobacteraceae bacterium]|nr:cytochrome P450 [Solirubrobacteraceae bacterium]